MARVILPFIVRIHHANGQITSSEDFDTQTQAESYAAAMVGASAVSAAAIYQRIGLVTPKVSESVIIQRDTLKLPKK